MLGLILGDRDVVGVDVHGVPADLVRGECDRIGFGDQELIAAQIDHGAVEPDPGPIKDSRILDGRPGERGGKQVNRQFAQGERSRHGSLGWFGYSSKASGRTVKLPLV